MVFPVLEVPLPHLGLHKNGHFLSKGVQESVHILTQGQISIHAPEVTLNNLEVDEAFLYLGQLRGHLFNQTVLLYQRSQLGLGFLTVDLVENLLVGELVTQGLVSIL